MINHRDAIVTEELQLCYLFLTSRTACQTLAGAVAVKTQRQLNHRGSWVVRTEPGTVLAVKIYVFRLYL